MDQGDPEDLLNDLPAVSDRADGFFEVVSYEARQMRLRAENLAQLGEISSDAMYDARKFELELFTLRKRFLRKEIDRKDCIERINQLVTDFAISSGDLDQENL